MKSLRLARKSKIVTVMKFTEGLLGLGRQDLEVKLLYIHLSKSEMGFKMTFEQDYLELLGQINHLTKEVTGVGIVDAYFGPRSLSPDRTKSHLPSEKFLINLNMLVGKSEQIDNELKRTAIVSDLESIETVVRWLSGEDIPYVRLVEEIFGIVPRKFGQKEIRKAQQSVEGASADLHGVDISEKILRWREESKITGEALKRMVDTEILTRTRNIRTLFKKKVLAHLPGKVENKGIIYKTVQGEPWTAYNYYQGNYRSVNAINVDMPLNRYKLALALWHEYEHHVANLFKEKYYRENKALDLVAVLLHTKRSVIDEGTADCAREFLDLKFEGENTQLVESLNKLEKMAGLNAAYMLNVENVDEETAAEYTSSETFRPVEDARRANAFRKPITSDGRPNFFKPYDYTYFFGKTDYVLPTLRKAQKKDKVKEFFQTLYLNPYSRSSATWKIAFAKI